MKKTLLTAACLLLALTLLAGCGQTAVSSVPTPIPSDADLFGYSDMVVYNAAGAAVRWNMTPAEVVIAFGEPTDVEDSDLGEDNTFVYGHNITYYYGTDLALMFFNFTEPEDDFDEDLRLGSAVIHGAGYTLANGLTVGATKDEAIAAFYSNADASSVVDIDTGLTYGIFLYGSCTPDTIGALSFTDAVNVAYINTYGSEYSDGDYRIEYYCYEPPYLARYAAQYDAHAGLVYYLDKTDTVNNIGWAYYPVV